MRVIRNSGQNVSPSDDGRLYNQAFEDGLFEATSITSLGENLVGLGAMYGIICGRDFTAESQSVNVLLPDDGTETGYIYIQYDTTTEDIITIESALAPFTPQYDDINTSGTICQMILAEYEANSVAVTDITSVYPIATTKPNNSLIGSMATIETSPATASHTVGSYILWNYQLYEVTSAISVGETLVVGSNIEATDMGSEISDLKSDLTSVSNVLADIDGNDSFGLSFASAYFDINNIKGSAIRVGKYVYANYVALCSTTHTASSIAIVKNNTIINLTNNAYALAIPLSDTNKKVFLNFGTNGQTTQTVNNFIANEWYQISVIVKVAS